MSRRFRLLGRTSFCCSCQSYSPISMIMFCKLQCRMYQGITLSVNICQKRLVQMSNNGQYETRRLVFILLYVQAGKESNTSSADSSFITFIYICHSFIWVSAETISNVLSKLNSTALN